MTDDPILTKADRTCAAILDSAYELFTSQGYAATSMRQIAEKGGLALGSIYNHFPAKESIFEAIIQTRHPFFLIIPIILEARGNSIDDFIRNSARSLVSELNLHPEFLNLMLTELVEFKGKHVPPMIEKYFPTIMDVSDKIASYQGELRPIPPTLLLRAFIGMFFSYFITELMVRNLIPTDAQVDGLNMFVDIFLNGIKQPRE